MDDHRQHGGEGTEAMLAVSWMSEPLWEMTPSPWWSERLSCSILGALVFSLAGDCGPIDGMSDPVASTRGYVQGGTRSGGPRRLGARLTRGAGGIHG
jgi:hypothetical protein